MAGRPAVLQGRGGERMKIFYSTVENFPPRRPDVLQLFMHDLPQLGVHTCWNMRRNAVGACETLQHLGQDICLPRHIGMKGIAGQASNRLFYWLCDLFGLTRAAWRKPDIIQVRDKYLAAVYGLMLAKLTGTKFTYWCSYPFPEHDLEMAKLSKGLRRAIYRSRGLAGFWILYKLVMPQADHVFAQSSQMKSDIVAYGLDAERISVVPMGIRDLDIPEVSPNVSEPNLIVYLGTLARIRRLDMLLRAFKRVVEHAPSARLVFVGDGDSREDREFLETEARRHGLDGMVEFTGMLPRDEALKWVQRATVCLSPFYPTFVLRSTSPTKLIEYMAMGKVVVANDHPEQAEVIGQSGAGHCVAWDEQAFADAILHIFQNPDLAAAMGLRGREWVARNRTYSQIARKLRDQYERILTGSGSGEPHAAFSPAVERHGKKTV